MRKQRIKITRPVNKNNIGYRQCISGTLTLIQPDEAVRVQVYVLAGDKRWYLQPEAVVEGVIWKSLCQFGDKDSARNLGRYKILAVVSDSRPKTPMSEMPEGVRSTTVSVRRLPITVVSL